MMYNRMFGSYAKRFVNYYCTGFPKNDQVLVECLPSRSILQISGNNVLDYLQGLVTNDMDHFNNGAKSIFAMFLNNKGRVLYDAIIYKGKAPDSYLIECDHTVLNDLKTHLNMYKVRRKISVDSLDNDLNIWNINVRSNVHKLLESSKDPVGDISNLSNTLTSLKGIYGTPDPRFSALGWRVIIPKQCYLVTAMRQLGVSPIEELYYKKLRYSLGVGEGAEELPVGNCFPLEANCDYLHGVSFHKGCYIGQELTARTHHTGIVRKRIMPLLFENNIPSIPPDSVVREENNEKTLGKIRGISGKFGIGLLRIEEVLKAEKLNADGHNLLTFRPFWWPTEAPKEKRNIAM